MRVRFLTMKIGRVQIPLHLPMIKLLCERSSLCRPISFFIWSSKDFPRVVSNLQTNRYILTASTIIGFILILLSLPAAFGQVNASKTKAVMTPLQMVQSGRYSQALPYFKAMAQKTPRDPSINYYLGLCAESAHEYDLAELAFCRIVVGTPPASPFVPLAQTQLRTLPHHLEPQCALKQDKISQWDRSAYPLRIFISDGRMTTGHPLGGILDPQEYKKAVAEVRSNLGRMPVSPKYQSAYAQLITEGIRGWDWAVREKLFNYTLVRDPRVADIVILFSDQTSGCTQWPCERGQPEIVWIGVVDNSPDDPVRANNWIKHQTTHEIGHCLGLWHSTGQNDVMQAISSLCERPDRQSADNITSANDKASLRALLSMPGDQLFYGAK
jgi:predicted Zn-dependent protease